MNALTVEERKRRAELSSQISRCVQQMEELADGFAFRFAPDAGTWMTLAEFSTLERRCCPFFAFSLSAEEEDGAMWMRITGREGVKQFLLAELGLAKL